MKNRFTASWLFYGFLLGMSIWIERSDLSLRSVLRDDSEAARMQNVHVCLEPLSGGENAVLMDSLRYDPESRRLLINQVNLSIQKGGFDNAIRDFLEFTAFFKKDFKSGQQGNPLRKRFIEADEPRCVHPICEINEFSMKTSKLIFSAKRFALRDGDFLYFKTACFKEIAGRDVSIRPIPTGGIKQIKAASLLWRYPLQSPVLSKGAVRYADRRIEAFENCVLDLSSMEILAIKQPAKIHAQHKLSILPGVNTRLWIRNGR